MIPELAPLEVLVHAVWKKTGQASFRLTAATKTAFAVAVDNYRHAVFEGVAGYREEEAATSYIHHQQAALTCLLDQLFRERSVPDIQRVLYEEGGRYAMSGRTFICDTLESLSEFLMVSFPDKYNRYAPGSRHAWSRTSLILKMDLDELKKEFIGLDISPGLLTLLKKRVNKRLNNYLPMSKAEEIYTWSLITRLQNMVSTRPDRIDAAICRIFLEGNFNCTRVAEWYTRQLQVELEELPDAFERSQRLSLQLKETAQVWVVTDGCLHYGRPSLKRMVMDWIGEELSYYRALAPLPSSPVAVTALSKIRSNLPVAQLACLIRLLIDTEALAPDNQLEVLRVIAQNFTSLRTDQISTESLRVKYYNPDRGTVSAMRDLLLRMIQQSRRLGL